MRRFLLFLIMMCLFATSARLEKLNLYQQRRDAKESLYMLHSAEIALDIPLTGSMTWEDMLGKDKR